MDDRAVHALDVKIGLQEPVVREMESFLFSGRQIVNAEIVLLRIFSAQVSQGSAVVVGVPARLRPDRQACRSLRPSSTGGREEKRGGQQVLELHNRRIPAGKDSVN